MTITAAAMPPIKGPFELSSSASETSSVSFPMPVTAGSWLRDVKVELETEVEVDRSEVVVDVFKSVRKSGLQDEGRRENAHRLNPAKLACCCSTQSLHHQLTNR